MIAVIVKLKSRNPIREMCNKIDTHMHLREILRIENKIHVL